MLGWETGLNMDNIVIYRLVLTQELSKLAPPWIRTCPAASIVRVRDRMAPTSSGDVAAFPHPSKQAI